MKRLGWLLFVLVSTVVVFAQGGLNIFEEVLTGYEEVPAISTDAFGTFHARINNGNTISYELSYTALSGDVQQAHIHFGQPGVNGGISVFLCTNLGNGPAGTKPCPPGPATISGTINPSNVIGPTDQGIGPGEFSELLAAIEAGRAYANVHSSTHPAGEIRAQLQPVARR
jgi:hypothetical protein